MRHRNATRTLAVLTVGVATLSTFGAASPVRAANTPLQPDTTTVDFGDVPIGDFIALQVHFFNTGSEPYGPISSKDTPNPSLPFHTHANFCTGATVAPGDDCVAIFSFTPTAPGPYASSKTLTLGHLGSYDDFTISLVGNAVDAVTPTTTIATTEPVAPTTATPSTLAVITSSTMFLPPDGPEPEATPTATTPATVVLAPDGPEPPGPSGSSVSPSAQLPSTGSSGGVTAEVAVLVLAVGGAFLIGSRDRRNDEPI